MLSAAALNLPSFKAIVAVTLGLLLKIFCPFAWRFALAFASLSLPLSAKISPNCASFRLRSRFSFFMVAFSLPAKASPPKFSSSILLSLTFTSPASTIFEPTSKPLIALNFSGSLMSRANLLKIWLFFRSKTPFTSFSSPRSLSTFASKFTSSPFAVAPPFSSNFAAFLSFARPLSIRPFFISNLASPASFFSSSKPLKFAFKFICPSA